MEIRCRKSGVSEIRCRSIILAREIRCRSIILAREIRCHVEIRSQSIILACGNPVSVHHSYPKRCGNMRKSGLSPSFLPEKMRQDEPTPDYAPRKDEPTPDYAPGLRPDTGLRPPDYAPEKMNRHRAKKLGKGESLQP